MLYEGPNKWKQKHRVPDTFYTNNDYANVIKFITEFNTEQAEITKNVDT